MGTRSNVCLGKGRGRLGYMYVVLSVYVMCVKIIH